MYLEAFDSSIVSSGDKDACSNFVFEVQARNDQTGEFSECTSSLMNDETSSQELCHSSLIKIKMINNTALRVTTNG